MSVEQKARLVEAVLGARSQLGARRPDPKHEPEDAQQWDDLTAAAAALSQPVGAGEGFVVVPRVPTQEMLRAGFDVLEIGHDTLIANRYKNGHEARAAVYTAMLAAAPTPPAAAQEDGRDADEVALAAAKDIALMWGQDRSQFIAKIQARVLAAMLGEGNG